MKKVKVYSPKRLMLFMAWVAPILVGAIPTGELTWNLGLIAIGMFTSMMFQHEYHALKGFSSTTYGGSAKRGVVWSLISIAIVLYFVFQGLTHTHLWFGLGVLSMLLYWQTHLDELWGIGSFVAVMGTHYVLTGTYTYQVMYAGIAMAMLGVIGILWYRHATGDYDAVSPETRIKRLPLLIVYYLLAAISLGLIL